MPHTLLFKRAWCSQSLLGPAGRGALLLLALLVGPLGAWGQTTLINETFETTNSFTLVNGSAANKWVRSTAAETAGVSIAGSTNSLYVSNSTATPPSYSYSNGGLVVHAYQDVTVPAGQSIITLTFRWKAGGENTFDYLRTSYSPTTFTPTVGTSALSPGSAISGSGTGAPVILVDNLYTTSSTPSYTTQRISLPASLAGTSFRLIFSWTNDGTGGIDPPASIDNILLTSAAPVPLCNTKTVGPTGDYTSLTAAFAALNLNGICGPLVFELQNTYVSSVETLPINYTFTGGSSTNTVTVRPAAGATGLSITTSATYAFNISGGKYLVIDGRPGGSGATVSGAATGTDLLVANTSTVGTTIRISSDATYN